MTLPRIHDFDLATVADFEGDVGAGLQTALNQLTEPKVLRNFCSHFPLVRAGQESDLAAQALLLSEYNGKPVNASRVPAAERGRVFYSANLQQFNYSGGRISLQTFFDTLNEQQETERGEAVYMGSTDVRQWFPHFADSHTVDLAEVAFPYLWVSSACTIAAHYDYPRNLACNLVGRRRFTLFPTEQINNLYPGPFDFAPGGQEVSLVDFNAIDFARFPRFRTAIEGAISVTLEPGDALYIPSMWWHHVESLGDFNVLYNHWWLAEEGGGLVPSAALKTAMLAIRNLAPQEKAAWQTIFNFYVFDESNLAQEHLPEAAQRLLADHPNSDIVRQTLDDIMRQLSRAK